MDSVEQVRIVSDIVMAFFLAFEQDVLRLIYRYGLLGEVLSKKIVFYYLKHEMDNHGADDIVVCLCEFNLYVDRHIETFG